MITFLSDALSVYRLTRLATRDTLPPLVTLRTRVEKSVEERHGPEWAEGVTCGWCSSMYVAAGVVLARRLVPGLWDPISRVLAFSAVAGFLSSDERG